MFDWNDLRYFLTVARHRSTIAAGKSLGLSQSTVQRRVSELERRIGRQLMARHPTGYRLTEFGEALLPYAERVEAAIGDFELRVKDTVRELAGVIRVTCPEPIDTDDELVGRKIADSIWAVYASRTYVERHGQPARVEDLSLHPLVGFDESLSQHRAAKWLREVVPDAKMAARNSSVLGLVSAVKSGIGIGPLPTALGDAEPDLLRVLGPIPELARSWRLLTHPDIRRIPRVAAFFDFVIEEREALKSILTG